MIASMQYWIAFYSNRRIYAYYHTQPAPIVLAIKYVTHSLLSGTLLPTNRNRIMPPSG